MASKRYTTPRTKELGARIDALLAKLEVIESDKRIKTSKGYETAVKKLCEVETQYWREKLGIAVERNQEGLAVNVHGSIPTLSSYFTDYRNAILDLYEGRMDDRNSYQREVGIKQYARIERMPIARKFFVKTSIEARVEADRVVQAKYEAARQLPTVSQSEVLAIARKLLDSKSYIANCIGLVAMTGRRPTEILKTARFEKLDDFSVIFWGQLKTKESKSARDGYEIPILIPADELIDRLAQLRAKKDFSQLDNRQVEKKTAVQIEDKMIESFFHLWSKPTAKDLRSIYAEIHWLQYCEALAEIEDLDSQRLFYAELLGHNDRDVETANSYIRFTVRP